MMFWMIGAGLGVLALLFRLAALTRLTIPLLYTVSMLTVFTAGIRRIPRWRTISCSCWSV